MEVRGVPVWDILALLAMGVGVWENSELVSATAGGFWPNLVHFGKVQELCGNS